MAAIVPAPDGERMVFVIPWGDAHLRRHHRHHLRRRRSTTPRCTDADVEYLLAALNGVTRVAATPDDVVGAWAGLRPLLRVESPGPHRRPVAPPRGAGRRQRHRHRRRREAHHLPAHGGRRGRRRPAPAARRARRAAPPARLRLLGADGIETPRPRCPHPAGAHGDDGPDRLMRRYGSEAGAVEAIARSAPEWSQPLVPGLAVPQGRGGVRRTRGDGPHARRRALAAHARADPRPRHDRGRRRARCRRAPRAASSVGPTTDTDAEVQRFRALAGADCP